MGEKQQIVLAASIGYAGNLVFSVLVWFCIVKRAAVCSDSPAEMHRRPSHEQKPPRQNSEASTHAFFDHRSTIFSLFDDFTFRVDTLL